MGWPRFAGAATGALSRAPYRATNRVMGCAKVVWRRHANHPTGAFGGFQFGATKNARGAPKLGIEKACEPSHGSLRWSSL